jgi:16S rRNA (cytosine1402-N4)-methyltransferase
MTSVHKTVLLKETIEGLDLKDNSAVVDATFGGGGHSLEICKRFSQEGKSVKIIALDQDKGAFKKAESKFEGLKCNIKFVNANFRNLREVLDKENAGSVDGIIMDLGLSSDQLQNSGRGFSFLIDEPLIMTMKENPLPEDVTAHDAVNSWEEGNLADIIYGFGEERFARRIAKSIVEARKEKEIKTTFDLVKIIERAVPGAYRRGRIHCATKTFQALRIAVNDELGSLEKGLNAGFEALKPGGRMGVISFHSLEDRIVKKFFKEKAKEGVAILMNKKPILAGEEELRSNPRSRSAKLRILSRR